MTTTTRPDAQDLPQPQGKPPVGLLRGAFRVVVGLIVAASFAVWGYAYSGFADRPDPDIFDSATLAPSLEATCAAAVNDVAELPDALDAADGPDRADQINRSTDRYEAMVDEFDVLVADLEASVAADAGVPTDELEPGRGTARDVGIAQAWIEEWRITIGDRRNYAEAIAVDPQAQYLVTNTGAGERLERRITRLARVNRMPSCGSPTDVG